METTTIKIDKDLKEEFEEKFKRVNKTRPSTSDYVETILQEKIEDLDREIAKQGKK